METKLTGGLKYCKRENCTHTVHYEDDLYPFCEVHKASNASYREYCKEHMKIRALYRELTESK